MAVFVTFLAIMGVGVRRHFGLALSTAADTAKTCPSVSSPLTRTHLRLRVAAGGAVALLATFVRGAD